MSTKKKQIKKVLKKSYKKGGMLTDPLKRAVSSPSLTSNEYLERSGSQVKEGLSLLGQSLKTFGHSVKEGVKELSKSAAQQTSIIGEAVKDQVEIASDATLLAVGDASRATLRAVAALETSLQDDGSLKGAAPNTPEVNLNVEVMYTFLDNISPLIFFTSIINRLCYKDPILFQYLLIQDIFILQNYKLDFKNSLGLDETNAWNNIVKHLNRLLKINGEEVFINTYLGKQVYEQILSESNIDLERASEDNDYTDETKSQLTSTFDSKILPKIEEYRNSGVPLNLFFNVRSIAEKINRSNNQEISNYYLDEKCKTISDNIKTFWINHIQGDLNAYVIGFKEQKTIIVSFRGTNSPQNISQNLCRYPIFIEPHSIGITTPTFEKINDEASNQDAWQNNNLAAFNSHVRGVQRVFYTIISKIRFLARGWLEGIDSSKPNYNLIITGHSLGGGFCTYFSFLYIQEYDRINKAESISEAPSSEASGGEDFSSESQKPKYTDYLTTNITCIAHAPMRVFNKKAVQKFNKYIDENRIKYLLYMHDKDFAVLCPSLEVNHCFYHPGFNFDTGDQAIPNYYFRHEKPKPNTISPKEPDYSQSNFFGIFGFNLQYYTLNYQRQVLKFILEYLFSHSIQNFITYKVFDEATQGEEEISGGKLSIKKNVKKKKDQTIKRRKGGVLFGSSNDTYSSIVSDQERKKYLSQFCNEEKTNLQIMEIILSPYHNLLGGIFFKMIIAIRPYNFIVPNPNLNSDVKDEKIITQVANRLINIIKKSYINYGYYWNIIEDPTYLSDDINYYLPQFPEV